MSVNVVSFSLYGRGAKYLDGAVANARSLQARPDWRGRFYAATDGDDAVPDSTLNSLIELGCEVVPTGRNVLRRGAFWRYRALGDSSVARAIILDVDYRVGRWLFDLADLWIASGKPLMTVAHHTELERQRHAVFLRGGDPDALGHAADAGLFAGVGDLIPDIDTRIEQFLTEQATLHRFNDSDFVQQVVLPAAEGNIYRGGLGNVNPSDPDDRRDRVCCGEANVRRAQAAGGGVWRMTICATGGPCRTTPCERLVKGPGKGQSTCVDVQTGSTVNLDEAWANREASCRKGLW